MNRPTPGPSQEGELLVGMTSGSPSRKHRQVLECASPLAFG